MKLTSLDIVSFNVPYPPNYGGAIDVYYRVLALSELGVKIHLHCYTYDDRQPAQEIEHVCEKVTYYHRTKNISSFLSRRPHIVASRMSRDLLLNLAAGEGPILFEGLHTCGFIGKKEIEHRPCYVRMHNIEWEYYLYLTGTSKSWWRKLHFKRESIKLRKFERKMLKKVAGIMAISSSDTRYFANRHKNVETILPFHQYHDIHVLPGEGSYVLLQGDLSVEDNLAVTVYLAGICKEINVPCKIAGRAPNNDGIARLKKLKDVDLHFDVPADEMLSLMQQAQIHIVDSSITSGFKLKMISALFTARHIVARKVLVSKNLRKVIFTYSDRSEIATLILPLMQKPISDKEIATRRSVLLPGFSNEANAAKAIKFMFDDDATS